MKKINTYETVNATGLILNANENPNNIERAIIDEIKAELDGTLFNRYPDDQATKLKEAYSEYINVPANQMIVGNGSDEMLGLLINLNIGEEKKLLTVEYDFSMYDYYVSMQGGTIVKFPYSIDETFDVEAFIALGKQEAVNLIILSTPNNPTGRIFTKQEMIAILEAFPEIIVIIDEAYAEFTNMSMIPYLNTYSNLLVTRTLSKAFGLAGVRCGFILGNKQLIQEIEPYKVPYNVNTLTQLSATITLQYHEKIMQEVDIIKQERERMYACYEELKQDKFELFESQANYFFGRCEDKDSLLKAFDDAKIKIRNFEGEFFRITVGNKEDNDKVLDVLKTL